MSENKDMLFVMFSSAHSLAIALTFFFLFLLYFLKNKWTNVTARKSELIFAISLMIMDVLYHIWLIDTGRWSVRHSLPLELCSISLLVAILLLLSGNKHLYDFVFFAGIAGALQAIVTPVLDVNFPHFRFFHFFYTHFGIIATALYFTWVKGYRPSIHGIMKTMVALNLLLPIILFANKLFDANYMFLRKKPVNGSLLDFLGPYPWYIVSLELVAFVIFILLWLAFREYRGKANMKSDE